MNALFFTTHGDIEQLRFGELPTPSPGPGEVLIRVKAAALNHLDLFVLKGWPGLKLAMPHIGGADIAGEIAALGPDVSGLALNQEVIAAPGYLEAGPHDEWSERGEDSVSPRYRIFGESRPGGFAEYVTAPAYAVFPKPASLSFAESCASLLTGLTAWRMLFVRGALKEFETVLVVGAGGGVSTAAIQLAKQHGARVYVLAGSREKSDKAYALGADEVLNYRAEPNWSKEVRRLTNNRGVDLVVDNVGAATFGQSITALARGGRLVTVGNASGPTVSFDNRYLFAKQLTILGSTMGSAEDFKTVLQWIEEGKLKPVIHASLPLRDGADGYRILQEGTQFGKVVLLP